MIVTSPSYLLDNTYRYGENEYIHHMDLYRLPIGYKEMGILGIPGIYSSALCIVEWPNRLESKFIPESYLGINITIPAANVDVSNVPLFSQMVAKDSIVSPNSNTDANDEPFYNRIIATNNLGIDEDSEGEVDFEDFEPAIEQQRILHFAFVGKKWTEKECALRELLGY